MHFSLAAIDVDGSLVNPVMRVAVLICAFLLAVPVVLVFRRAWPKRARLAGIIVIFAAGCALSPVANRIAAMSIYQVITGPGVSVGFFGGPPFFASPLLAVAMGSLAAFVLRLRQQKFRAG